MAAKAKTTRSKSRTLKRSRGAVMSKRVRGAKSTGNGKKHKANGKKQAAGPKGRRTISLNVRKGRVMATTGMIEGMGVREVENLDKVKEILFGAEKRETENRLKALEKAIRRDLEEVSSQIGKRLDSLEAYAKKEFKATADELRSEQKTRQSTDDDLSKKVANVDEQLNKSRRELRDEILDLSKAIRAELASSASTLTKSLAKSSDELRDEKTSRADLAALLVDMALRLSKDVELTKLKK